MFTGRWKATAALDQTWLSGRPELLIGHFGPELTGVVSYKDALGVVPQEACPCAFIEHDTVDLDGASFVARSERCGIAPTLVWDLELVEDGDDVLLAGKVGPDENQQVDITFLLLDTFVPDDARTCE